MRLDRDNTNVVGCSAALLGAVALATLLGGCSRADYRLRADHEVYGLVNERLNDPRWQIPHRPVTADPNSRLADQTDPDRGPLPPDDPAAAGWMKHPYKFTGWKGWYERGQLPSVEFSAWREGLPRDDDGQVQLAPDNVMPIGLTNSREYQNQVEALYLDALSLSFERFEFDVRWFAGNRTTYRHRGNSSLPTESNTLTLDNSVSLQRNLAAGGQVLVDFANSFVWEFTGRDSSFASSGLLFTLTQPLLRGAFKQVRLEALTQAERDLLYSVRNFARFRRLFYVNVMSRSGYLGLLATLQGIRNQEFNLQALENSLLEHEALAAAGQIRPIQVDQVFQNYQTARLGLLTSRRGYENAQDRYKIILGLPPEMEVDLDDSQLDRFELNDPALDELRARNEEFYLETLQPDVTPPIDQLRIWFEVLIVEQSELELLLDGAFADINQWKERLAREQAALAEMEPTAGDRPAEAPTVDEPDTQANADEPAAADKPANDGDLEGEEETLAVANPEEQPELTRSRVGSAEMNRANQYALERQLSSRLEEILIEIRDSLQKDVLEARAAYESLATADPDESWQIVRQQIGQRFRERSTDVFVSQSQIRVYLIELPEVELEIEEAVDVALENRLDLMNQRGNVMDTYRRVEVAADALEADLGVRASANLLTDADQNNPLRFDASANRYSLGLEFDAPITRRLERNAYRAAQLRYQRSRRDYMAAQDSVVRDIRAELRQLELDRFGFEIARQSLVTAARQVDEAQINLRGNQQTDSSLTQDLLGALSVLLAAKNGLIASWVDYETSRMILFRDLGLLEVSAEGEWVNERDRSTAPDGSDGDTAAETDAGAAQDRPTEELPAPH